MTVFLNIKIEITDNRGRRKKIKIIMIDLLKRVGTAQRY